MTAPVPPGPGAQGFGPPAYGPEAYAPPGQPPSQYGYAGPAPDPTAIVGRRIGAFFIDAAIVLVMMGTAFFVMADHTTISAGARKYHECSITRNTDLDTRELTCDWPKIPLNADPDVFIVDGPPFFAVTVLISFLYFLVPQALAGCTLGKLMVGIRVVKADGGLPGMGRAATRWILFLVDGPLTMYLCGLITMLVSKGHRRVGDMAAGTYVVSRAAAGQPIVIPGAAAPMPYYPQPPYQAPPSPYPPPPTAPEQVGWASPPPPAAPPPSAPQPPPPAPVPPAPVPPAPASGGWPAPPPAAPPIAPPPPPSAPATDWAPPPPGDAPTPPA